MRYPEETMALDVHGKREARVLISAGADFIVYCYADAESGKRLDKYSILLRKEDGVEHLLIIRLPNGKELVVKHETERRHGKRGIYDEKGKKSVYF